MSVESLEPPGPLSPGDPRLEEASSQYVGRWNRLVSTTNWEKGRIVQAWRTELIELGAPSVLYSDEAWGRQVGGVSSQHVGRLRRVFERFDAVRDQYQGLYWSHFQAALDWNDAEMWLEGAVANRWSVTAMRQKRLETLGAVAGQEPRAEDLFVDERDEDAEGACEALPETVSDTPALVEPAETGEWDTAPGDAEAAGLLMETMVAEDGAGGGQSPLEPVRPFEGLRELPDDLAEAVEALKLAIVRHRLSGWREVRVEDVLAVLGALKQLALAPAE